MLEPPWFCSGPFHSYINKEDGEFCKPPFLPSKNCVNRLI